MNMTTNNTKTHFKMYKSGKQWLYVSITTFGCSEVNKLDYFYLVTRRHWLDFS
ncbi:KxYKxGKxW signal peptide domain-containing protein [Weissella fabalis]|uniref:KxYKxGKxW signal peptide domain-containing protein n=2 Tax=Periweissella fabalis TaxID=1070421 RepID=A0A7X6N0F8_9LACO|nr:KxYKxGKxW signal peptide domain-containing protein [Periweissella fabalis]NKZ23431.1 KxYKxGKxW signal peptide domain-containing protein [Periweissella fabalis]